MAERGAPYSNQPYPLQAYFAADPLQSIGLDAIKS